MIPPTTQQVLIDYRIATMRDDLGVPYGMLDDHWIGIADGKITWIRPQGNQSPQGLAIDVIVGNGRLLTPGLIDCHTHLVYGGNRADEWERRLGGESYQSIAAGGGGILSTVQATRSASEEELYASAVKRLNRLAQEGLTTIEIKSGYGLDLETELKMLRVARRLSSALPIDIETTLLAAHAIPREFAGRADAYVDWVCEEMLPAARGLCSAADVFCETIAFSLSQSRRVLETAVRYGMKIKIHAEQLSHTGSAVMAAELGALSVDHVEYLTDADCRSLAQYGTVATLLPGAFYFLRETQSPPIRALVDNDVPMAIATDSNPGSSPFLSLLTVANLGCVLFGLTPEQVLAGVTRNAALALGLLGSRGTIEVGKNADFAVWDVKTPAEIMYAVGGNPCVGVFKNGVLR